MARDQGPHFAPLRASRGRDYPYPVTRYTTPTRRRMEQLGSYALAAAIGAGLALALVAWWS